MRITNQAFFSTAEAGVELGWSPERVLKRIRAGRFGPKENLHDPGNERVYSIPHAVLDAVANGRPVPGAERVAVAGEPS